MIYQTIKEFIKTAKTSRSTIYRFYRTNDLLWDETKLKSNRRLIPTAHAKYFDSEILFDELQASSLENRSLKRLIDLLADKETLPTTFWGLGWSFFFPLMARIYHKIVDIDSADLQSVPTKIGDSKCLASIYI